MITVVSSKVPAPKHLSPRRLLRFGDLSWLRFDDFLVQEKIRVEDILRRLQEEGISPSASVEEQLCCVWRLLLRNEDKLQSATRGLEELRQQQAEEMREVRPS